VAVFGAVGLPGKGPNRPLWGSDGAEQCAPLLRLSPRSCPVAFPGRRERQGNRAFIPQPRVQAGKATGRPPAGRGSLATAPWPPQDRDGSCTLARVSSRERPLSGSQIGTPVAASHRLQQQGQANLALACTRRHGGPGTLPRRTGAIVVRPWLCLQVVWFVQHTVPNKPKTRARPLQEQRQAKMAPEAGKEAAAGVHLLGGKCPAPRNAFRLKFQVSQWSKLSVFPFSACTNKQTRFFHGKPKTNSLRGNNGGERRKKDDGA